MIFITNNTSNLKIDHQLISPYSNNADSLLRSQE